MLSNSPDENDRRDRWIRQIVRHVAPEDVRWFSASGWEGDICTGETLLYLYAYTMEPQARTTRS